MNNEYNVLTNVEVDTGDKLDKFLGNLMTFKTKFYAKIFYERFQKSSLL